MTTTAPATAGFVLGDGTTPGQKAAGAWKRWNWIFWVVVCGAGFAIVSSLVRLPRDVGPMSIYATNEPGASAVARVLENQGVEVTQVGSLEAGAQTIRPGDTLVIARYTYFTEAQLQSIFAYEGPIVWIEPGSGDLEFLDDSLSMSYFAEAGTAADCDSPAAQRAGSVSTPDGASIQLRDQPATIEACFTRSPSALEGDTFADYVIVNRPGESPVHVIADSQIFTNGTVANAGNAALALNVTGTVDRVVWYAGGYDSSLFDVEQSEATEYIEPQTPGWLAPLMAAGAATIVVAMLWRGRRMGRLVSERLPVVVRSSETTRGRARLYRQSGARGHAAAAMRAAAISRMARRIGVSRTADHDTVVGALVPATQTDPAVLRELLYGPPPANSRQLIDLVKQLDELERKVSRS